MTSPLPTVCSTTELQRHYYEDITCGPGRTRTCEDFRQGVYSPPPLPLGTLTHFVVNLVLTGL